jgi:hypothetical protein
MRTPVALLGLLLVAAPAGAAGQWGLGLEVGLARFAGTSRDTSGTTVNGSFRPYVPWLFGLGIERRVQRVTVGLRLSFANAAVALATDGPTLVEPAAMLHGQIAPEVGGTLARSSTGATLAVRAGPIVEFWTLDGEDARWRTGGQVGLVLECPLVRRVAARVTVRAGVTPSVLTAEELPPEFVRRTSWRTGVALGLRYGR